MANETKQEIEDMWIQVKDATKSVFERDITPDEFFYLMGCYPYLEICDTDYPFIDAGTKPKIIDMPNGWKIFDFKSVLVAGNSELLQRERSYPRPGSNLPPGIAEDDDEEGGGGYGTIVAQYASTAQQMIAVAMQKGWSAAEVISGFYPMQRLAWVTAREKGYRLKGFEPTAEDYVVANWIEKMHRKELFTAATQFPAPKFD